MSQAREIHQSEPQGDALKPESEISRRELLSRLSPLGKVELDSSRCTGCGLCAAECPTGALLISSGEETDAFQLLFKHGICVACGLCAEICPEKCLRVERILEVDKVGSQSVLFEDTLVRCSECGQPLGPKSMVDKMQAKVKAAGKVFPFQFELCPDCKVRAQFHQLRM
jgi:ferredoxin